METSTYGSELVAMRIAVELLLEVRYKLRMMGLNFAPCSTILGDNQSVITNMQLPSSNLKKKHNSVAFHKAREAFACSIARAGHIRGTENPADILTKPLGPKDFYKYTGPLMFGRINTEEKD